MTPAPYTLSHMPSQQQISELYDLYTAHPAVTTDSRHIPEGAIFFALRGPSFDGNAFAAEALRKGAALAVVDDPEAIPSGTNPSRDYFLVDNVLQTLQELAAMHRTRLGIPILAITGTNGKTTTKELVHAVLSQKYRVYATQGNLNNHIGVPLTLLRRRQRLCLHFFHHPAAFPNASSTAPMRPSAVRVAPETVSTSADCTSSISSSRGSACL